MDSFEALEQHYPEMIMSMDNRFNAHTFILKLAYNHQSLYIKALMDCVNEQRPFQAVHKRLADMLHKFPELIQHTEYDRESSIDIFNHSSKASVWYNR